MVNFFIFVPKIQNYTQLIYSSIITALSLLFFNGLKAQVIYYEHFENFTIGNLSPASDGYTPGQDNWFSSSHWTRLSSTPYEHLFQIENDPTKGKVVAMLPHPNNMSSTDIRKNIESEIASRTNGNDVF